LAGTGYDIRFFQATANFQKYGVLYNCEAAKRACPPGWHLSSDEEWIALEVFLGMSESEAYSITYWRTGSVGKKMKSATGWKYDLNGDNTSGFNALPGSA